MRAPYSTLGPVVLVSSLAACASAPRASADEFANAVRESDLDTTLKANCGRERFDFRDAVTLPVTLVVRPDGTVEPGSVRVTSGVSTRYTFSEEMRRSEGNLRSEAISRARGCTFTPPTLDGQPVHARVQRPITIPL